MKNHLSKIGETFYEVMQLGSRLGVKNINTLPGCWEHQVDDKWFIAVNAHDSPVECSKGPSVAPFHCYVEYNGFPAGLISPHDGIIAAGECANEDTFIAALKAASPERSEPKR